MQALAIVRERGLDCTLRHVGDGPLREKLHAETDRLGLTDSVQWLGPCPHEHLPKEYAQADAFVLACQKTENGDRDGIPNVLAESMSIGVPVVTTRVSGIPELITNEITGLLVEPDDPHALAQKLYRILTDRELREHMIPSAREKIVTMFDNTACIKKLAQVFHEA